MRPGTPGFVGARLRHGRETRGLTASTLAELAGVTRAAISQYEGSKKSTPSPEVLRRISVALNLPHQWFLRPLASRQSGTIFFRCMHSATKGARMRAERRYDCLRDIARTLRNHIKFPQVRFPELEFPSDPSQINDEAIDDAATELRRFWGMQDGPISNMTWLLENNGAIVSKFELLAGKLDAFSEWEPQEDTPYIVLGADKASACRSRFDAAHELAHLLLHRKVPKSAYTFKNSFSLMEEQAHRFAGAFLLPAETFTREVMSMSPDALLSLKQRWRVSVAAMIMRLTQLRLIGEEQSRRLWMNLGRRRWRTNEPLDDVIEPEQPQFLRRCFELLIGRGVLSAAELPFHIGLPACDIEQLAMLPAGYLNKADRSLLLSDNEEEETQIVRFPRAQ